MDPQPHYYESKKQKYENSLFTELLSAVGQFGNVSKKKRLKKFIEKINEYEPEIESCALKELENDFIVSRERYKKEAARLKLKIVAVILVIPLIVYRNVTEMSEMYTAMVQPDEGIPKSSVIAEMMRRFTSVAIAGFAMAAFVRVFVLKHLYMIQSKLIDLYENFKVMITKEKTQVYSDETLNQHCKVIDLLLEDDPPIWNHQEALDQLNRKYLLLTFIPILIILVVPIIGQTIFFIRFIKGDSDSFPLLAISSFNLYILAGSYFMFCFDRDKFKRDCDRIFSAENSEKD